MKRFKLLAIVLIINDGLMADEPPRIPEKTITPSPTCVSSESVKALSASSGSAATDIYRLRLQIIEITSAIEEKKGVLTPTEVNEVNEKLKSMIKPMETAARDSLTIAEKALGYAVGTLLKKPKKDNHQPRRPQLSSPVHRLPATETQE